MKAWISLLVVSVALIILAASAMLWERRSDRTSPAAGASQTDSLSMTEVIAGGPALPQPPGADKNTHEELSGYDISEGKRLYHWFNCNTCHANGGGDIGPALMDDKWLYGAEPRNIFASIVEGRPNGMPSFRGKIPDQQVWQIVAYVRSMSGHVPTYAPSSRNDDISAKPPETQAPREPINKSSSPSPDNRSTNE